MPFETFGSSLPQMYHTSRLLCTKSVIPLCVYISFLYGVPGGSHANGHFQTVPRNLKCWSNVLDVG